MRPFVDTNVLVYAHDQDEPEKRAAALDLLGEVGSHMVISAQVLAEFFVTVTRKLDPPLSTELARQQVENLRPSATVTTDADMVTEAVELSLSHQLSLWDAMIMRAAVRAGCDVLYSEDLQDGFSIDGVEVRNPFGSGSSRR